MLSQKRKLKFMEDYIHKHYNNWFKKQPENIVGVRVGKKQNSKPNSRYVIIFHVVKKLSPEELTAEQQLPEEVELIFPDLGARKIRTVVEETGKFQFHFEAGKQINNYTANEAGSLGPFLSDGTTAYMSTNFHVAAWQLMLAGQFFFNVDNGDGPLTLNIDHQNCALVFGSFSESVDLGLIGVGHPADFNNLLPDGNKIQNSGFVTPQNYTAPLYSYCPRSHPTGYTINVISRDMSFNTLFKEMVIEHVIMTDLYSQHGDSGSPVVDSNFKMVGLLVGGDDRYSYIIPFATINAYITKYFKPLHII